MEDGRKDGEDGEDREDRTTLEDERWMRLNDSMLIQGTVDCRPTGGSAT